MNNEKENIKKELNEIESNLKLPDDNSLNVPEGYFELLEKDILDKTIYADAEIDQHSIGHKTKVLQMKWVKIVSGAAAMIILSTVIKLLVENKTETIEIQLANMSNLELNQYIDNKIASITSEELHSFLTEYVEEFDAELLFETNFITDASAGQKITEDINEQIMNSNEATETNKSLLDQELLKQIDEQTIQNYINEEALYNDFGL